MVYHKIKNGPYRKEVISLLRDRLILKTKITYHTKVLNDLLKEKEEIEKKVEEYETF